jgi:hypothetical protein
MKKLYNLILLVLITNTLKTHSQLGLSHEVGVIAGPLLLQSDYGEQYNFETNISNMGIGIGVVHYLGFYFDSECKCKKPYSYFSDHFKIRSDLSYNRTDLRHFGKWVDNDRNGIGPQQLRAMRGVSTNINIGMMLEYYPLSLRNFDGNVGALAPYVSIGTQYVWTNPEASTTLGRLGDPAVTFPKYLNAFSNESESIWSVVASLGTRYKIGQQHDLSVDLRWQYYFSDWVDGLNPDPKIYTENKSNDWIFWLNFGYIYYIY